MITLIATVLNEGDNIRAWLESFTQQTRLPDEIIIVDGGSTDNTPRILAEYAERLPLRVIVEPGCNISEGRNIAIHAARGDILAITDAGTRLPPTWVERITQPLLDNKTINVVAGFFEADPQTVFEAAMGATVLPLVDDIDPDSFLPSSRSVALRTEAAVDVGGYPEWLDYCEDLIFDLRLQALHAPFHFQADAVVYFRPRSDLRAFFKQYYRYARGDGKADLWRKRHAIRYLTYLVALPLGLALMLLIHPSFALLFVVGGLLYCAGPYRRLPSVIRRLPRTPTWLDWLIAAFWIPVIRAVGDIAKMLGYPVGWRWRLQYRPPDWHQVTP